MSINFKTGSIVWAKLGQNWWPGRVSSIEDCPHDYTNGLKKKPVAIVKFFNESGFHEVSRDDFICSYNCSRKDVYIKKGLKSVQNNADLKGKFEADVIMSEKLTGGNMDIIKEMKNTHDFPKRRIDYSDLGFGAPSKPKKNINKDQSVQRKGFTNIGEAIQYKKSSSPVVSRVIEYHSKILDQPIRQKSIEEEMRNSGVFKCYCCNFTCSRIGVIVWHNKSHMNKVADFGAGLTLPRKRKRKPKQVKAPVNQNGGTVTSSPMVNGHADVARESMDTSKLLQDWSDEDSVSKSDDESATPACNEFKNSSPMNSSKEENLSDGSDEDVSYRAKTVPKPFDIDSAFDALLAESSLNHTATSNTSKRCVNYSSNDSDSDGSDWGKYCKNITYNSESATLPNSGEIIKGNSPSRSLTKNKNRSKNRHTEKESSGSYIDGNDSSDSEALPKRPLKETVVSSTNSNSSSTSSGPAYMLVAVDAQGNNIPMPVLSEGGSHLVAVEASMEDGSTRTLYIDPAHLGPNVDLNNLMLHIDNSGQETVIIPTSSSETETTQTTSQDHVSAVHSSPKRGLNEERKK